LAAGALASIALGSIALGCGSREPLAAIAPLPPAPSLAPPPHDPRSIIADPAAVPWARETMSPRWDAPGVRLPGCVAYELPLSQVASAIALAKARSEPVSELADVNTLLRALGGPHVWPRLWTLEMHGQDAEQLHEAWSSWAAREPAAGERRCGTASVNAPDGRTIIAVVVVDVLADLAPVPLRARTGQWLRIDARLLTDAQRAELVVLDPAGAPRPVPGSLHGGSFHAVFSADSPGLWRLQLLVDRGQGPRPALEAWVFVDREPDLAEATPAVPGPQGAVDEHASLDVLRATLSGLIDAARRQTGAPSLRRDTALDQLAQAHAAAMASRGQTAHDVGDGPPADRLARAGVSARRIGENVARAPTLERAHRVLWDSPSHRGNIVDPSFDALGVGVLRAAGDVWVCELFADRVGVVSRRSGD
jgi:cysteine-rich secretory family protein